ncbi:Serine/threonine protein Kinase [Phytophthora cinnamomi]|uniref:Serine/threonine protein Kinase n=1 Tax=Phytophthora cinnamomi TaxID=4785 RepID=UPI00355A8328|nr:Serine/threonine protein Kinase [Phytophthora cinnamomi]
MAEKLIHLALPHLGSALALLTTVHAKYSELNEVKDLCARLEERLKDFAHELAKLEPDTLRAEELLGRLNALIEEFLKTVTMYAELNFVKRVVKLGKFKDDIKIHNESLDHIINMLSVKDTEKLVKLLDWRDQFKQDAEDIAERLIGMRNLLDEIRDTLYDMKEDAMATKSDFKELVMLIKRDVSDPERIQQPHEEVLRSIIEITMKNHLDNQDVETPPTWLIAGDEVLTRGEPIDSEGLTSIFVGEWQGAQVAVKKFGIIGDSPVFDKHFRIWSTLLHPHVIQLYGAGTDNGAPFFVYEYAHRQSLDQCWSDMLPVKLWGMLHQAALGLIYLHKKHVVHGNLSCSKLLVTDTDKVKLFGFGASYVRKKDKSNSVKADTYEEFAAPECIGILDGIRHSPRFESDVYSFGLTIMQAITKKNPFDDMSPKAIRAAKQNNQLSQPPEMKSEAWVLVKEMCVCDPKRRVSLDYVAMQLGSLTSNA